MAQKTLPDIQITVRGRQFSCPVLSSEHAIFWGTLLMDEEELRVFIDGEDPSAAMDMMRSRLVESSAQMSKILSGGALSAEEISKQIDGDQVQKIVQRLIVRINQDQMPGNMIVGIRYKVANRLREVFPDFPLDWVSPTSINLEVEELVTAIAIPLFATMSAQAEEAKVAEPKGKAKGAKSSKGFKAEVAAATPIVPAVEVEAIEVTETEAEILRLQQRIAELTTAS